MRSRIPAFLLLLIFPLLSYGQVNWKENCQSARVYDENTGTYAWKGARGKYFCEQKREEPEEKPKPPATIARPEPKSEKPKKKDCSDPDQWDAKCGFVNPDKLSPEDAFAFQSKQRDTLIQNMSVRPDSMKAVVSAQKYMNWVVDKAMLLADMYSYSAVQNPELDPNASHTASSVGQKMIAARDINNRRMFWGALRSWDAELIIFTRASCDFCSQQADALYAVQRDSGLPLIEVALEEECVSNTADTCIKGENAQKAGQWLNVTGVPTTLVFVPDKSKKDDPSAGLWMRVSNGYSTSERISQRLYTYLNAWHSAALKGLSNAMDKPDFSGTEDITTRKLRDQLSRAVGNKRVTKEEEK